MSTYKKESLIKCQVTGIEKYGIFVNVDQYYNGLIHISEISNGFVRDINEYVKIDETIYAKILEIDEENAQLKLSIKDIDFKINRKFPKVNETTQGFKPLGDALDEMIANKLKEMEDK